MALFAMIVRCWRSKCSEVERRQNGSARCLTAVFYINARNNNREQEATSVSRSASNGGRSCTCAVHVATDTHAHRWLIATRTCSKQQSIHAHSTRKVPEWLSLPLSLVLFCRHSTFLFSRIPCMEASRGAIAIERTTAAPPSRFTSHTNAHTKRKTHATDDQKGKLSAYRYASTPVSCSRTAGLLSVCGCSASRLRCLFVACL